MEPLFELPIRIPPRHSRDRVRALHAQLRAAILQGRLKPGLKLPATRALAAAYGVSRNTVVAAYDLLLSEGYLVARRGSGTFVADVLPRFRERSASRGNGTGSDPRINPYWRQREPLPGDHPLLRVAPRLDFHLGVPDAARFPFDIWRRLTARSLRTASRRPASYDDACGRPALREAIAKHVSFARAVACSPSDVIVTAGAQQAFDLLARVLVMPGRTVVAVENPGYPPLRAAFAAFGAKIAPVPVDGEGLMVERVPEDAGIICVTPSHQYPLGVVMSARRRAALLELAQKRRAIVIEDDYDAEFRYGDRPLDALQTLDRSSSVFYVGTFSKSLFPGIRLGFVVAPEWARRALGAAKQCADWHCCVLTQDTLAAFIEEGHLARHVRRMRSLYAARRAALLDGLRTHFSGWLDPVPSAAGLHLCALADASVDMEAFVDKARERGVGVYSLRRYYAGRPGTPGLLFGYGTISEDDIDAALAILRRIPRVTTIQGGTLKSAGRGA